MLPASCAACLRGLHRGMWRVVPGQEVRGRRRQVPRNSLCSLVAERQSCKLKVLGSIPSGGFFRQIAPCALMSLLSPRDFQFFLST